MANLKEIAQWEDGIYQLERTDPVVGGEGGISNRQGLQLANRTAWLKQLVETLAPLDSPTFTGSPKAPTPAQTVNDTTIATTAFVKAAIAALVGSAPATLDTLAEIAKALGNDGNLKATLLTEISKKATASNTLAGYGITNAVEVGGIIDVGPNRIRLGWKTSAPYGLCLTIDNSDQGILLLSNSLSDVVNSTSTTTPANVAGVKKAYDKAIEAFGTASKAQNGWCKLPNGLILQWGQSELIDTTFPIAFPTACFNIQFSDIAGGDWIGAATIRGFSKTGFKIYTSNDIGAFMWFAVGY